MKEFIDYLLQFGNLNPQQADLISKKAKVLKLRKDDYFAEAGRVLKQVGFITEGVIRSCYYDKQGEEITRYFVDENHLILGWKNFDENIPLSEYMQAITDCQLIVFSKQDWKEISNTIIGWDNIIQKITAKNHAEKIREEAR